MTENELKKLKRTELLEIIREQSVELERLTAETSGKETGSVTDRRKLPEREILEKEIQREKYKRRYKQTLRSTVGTLVVVAAVAVLIAVLFLPVLKIYGSSMTPGLKDGEIIVSARTSDLKTGDVVAFYYNNKILVKRVIASSGDWVDIDEKGNVYVNQQLLEEPYLEEKALGDCNIELPYQVPDERFFLMGDHRSVSVDSRNTSVGCVAEEQIVGKLIFRIWPLKTLGPVH